MRHLAVRETTARSRARLWWASEFLVALTAVVIVLALREGAPGAPTVHTSHASDPGITAPDSSPTPEGEADAAEPVRLRISSIDVSTDLVMLGLHADHTVEVPQDPARAGWFDKGPTPGQEGSSVILGHVDSPAGPAVFARLDELRQGDEVEVALADGAVARFEVDRIAVYDNEDFPARRVYAGSPRRPTLNLVTCGGVYDPAKGGYQSNVVVFTEYLDTEPAP